MLFIDESGFLLIPSVRKTWSPVGQTPILRHGYRHERIAAISGIAVSPRRFHCSLYCQLYEDNIQGEEVACFCAIYSAKSEDSSSSCWITARFTALTLSKNSWSERAAFTSCRSPPTPRN